MRFIVINGPNLNLLGTREPEIYGSETLADLEGQWRRRGTRIGIGVDTFQSNHEGEIIDEIHNAGPRHDALIVNAGALSHTSYSIYDALIAIGKPTVEVHISDIYDREPWRAVSVTAPAALRVMAGRGSSGYLDAIDFLEAHLRNPGETISYGSDPDQVFDLRIPPSPKGAIVLIHGGFWRRMWERDIMEQLADRLARDGWITANVEYRRGPDSFSTSNDDIATAVDRLQRLLVERGFDVGTPIRIGHSAGGYLAIRSVTDAGGHAIALGAVLDIDATSASRPDDDPVAAYLGGSAAEAASTWEAARLDGPGRGSVDVIHGTHDDAIPVDHARAFAEHGAIALTILDGVDHRSLTDPHHASYRAIVEALDRR